MTKLFGVIGHPIDHSLSPVMHTAAFRAMRLDALYGAFDVPPASIRPVLRALILSGVEGLNVTVPLKEAVLPLMDRLDRSAAAIGAVNTIVIRDRRAVGHNTDAFGFLMALKSDLRLRPRGLRVLLLGAGGAARAVAWALAEAGVRELWVANRHGAANDQLIRSLRRSGCLPPNHVTLPLVPGAIKCVLPDADLLVNATSVGMRPDDPSPVPLSHLRRHTAVMDLVYHRQTALVASARRRGCVAAGGLSMLLYQGAESLRLWFKRSPPMTAMRRALMAALADHYK